MRENKISAKHSVVGWAQPSPQVFPARSNPTVSGDVTKNCPFLPRLRADKRARARKAIHIIDLNQIDSP